MRRTCLELNDVFVKNSLRNLKTRFQGPMPHSGNTFYLPVRCFGNNEIDKELHDYLIEGNSWKAMGNSVNSYIDISPTFENEHGWALTTYGPNNNSSSRTIEITLQDGNARIIARGWGSSSCEIYDGETSFILEYFKQNQIRNN